MTLSPAQCALFAQVLPVLMVAGMLGGLRKLMWSREGIWRAKLSALVYMLTCMAGTFAAILSVDHGARGVTAAGIIFGFAFSITMLIPVVLADDAEPSPDPYDDRAINHDY